MRVLTPLSSHWIYQQKINQIHLNSIPFHFGYGVHVSVYVCIYVLAFDCICVSIQWTIEHICTFQRWIRHTPKRCGTMSILANLCSMFHPCTLDKYMLDKFVWSIFSVRVDVVVHLPTSNFRSNCINRSSQQWWLFNSNLTTVTKWSTLVFNYLLMENTNKQQQHG